MLFEEESNAAKTMYAIRTEHLEHNWMTVNRMLSGKATKSGEEEYQTGSNRNGNDNHSFAFLHNKQMEQGRNNHSQQDTVPCRTIKYKPSAVPRNTSIQKDIEVGRQYRSGR